jgi:hypothetical protein
MMMIMSLCRVRRRGRGCCDVALAADERARALHSWVAKIGFTSKCGKVAVVLFYINIEHIRILLSNCIVLSCVKEVCSTLPVSQR